MGAGAREGLKLKLEAQKKANAVSKKASEPKTETKKKSLKEKAKKLLN